VYSDIGGVIVDMLASSAVDREFETRKGKPNILKLLLLLFHLAHII
jgi:hypothetical protein